MRVAVNLFEVGLVHVLVGVLGAVFVGVRMLVGHVVVIMCGVRVRVSHVAMLMFVRVRRVMGVLLGHNFRLLVWNMLWLLVFRP